MNIATATTTALDRLGALLQDQTFTWRGAEIPCVPNGASVGTTVEVGGYQETVALVLYVKRDRFLTMDSTLVTMDSNLFTMDNDKPKPVSGRKLTFNGREYRILTAREDGSRAYYTLNLADPKR